MGYWRIVKLVWDAINIYDSPEVFAQTFGAAPRASGFDVRRTLFSIYPALILVNWSGNRRRELGYRAARKRSV